MDVNFDPEILLLAEQVLSHCRKKKCLLATAESCTGGLVVGTLTEIAGSSDVVDRGFVTYSNSAKSTMLGVPEELIREHGAVSEPVAVSMAAGAIGHSNASIAVSITGIAGPGGGTPLKPVGLVHFAVADRSENIRHAKKCFGNHSRNEIRVACVRQALGMIRDHLESG